MSVQIIRITYHNQHFNIQQLDLLRHKEITARTAPHEDLYILYTSGSTGEPRGVIGQEKGTSARLQWGWDRWPLSPTDVVGRQAWLGFVDSVAEMLGSVLCGCPMALLQDPGTPKFVSSLALCRVTRLTVVPSVLQALCELGPSQVDTAPPTVPP